MSTSTSTSSALPQTARPPAGAYCPLPAAYPADVTVDVVLRNGTTVQIRPARPEDAPALLRFLQALSEDALYARFFALSQNLDREAAREAQADGHATCSLLALAGPEERVVGQGMYGVLDPDASRAEVAFAVAEDRQDQGLATLLLGQLAEVAAANGLRLSALAGDVPLIAEMDCNPVFVRPEGAGAVVVDARIRVEPVAPPRPLGARR